MDTILWIVIFLIVFFVVVLILPTNYSDKPAKELQRALETKRLMERKPTCEVIGPCERPCRYNSLNAEKNRYKQKASIDSQFMKAKDVPNDYPTLGVGCCPYGKPLSRDLPMADVPMCMAKSSSDMRLHE